MVAVFIYGGIGEQLFQYATARAASLRENLDSILYEFSKLGNNPNWLEKFEVVPNSNQGAQFSLITEPDNYYHEEVLQLQGDVALDGSFQFERYFADYSEQIHNELVLKDPLSDESSQWEFKIRADRFPVSMHMSENVSMKYYEHCVNFLKANFPNISLYVFTNDIPSYITKLKFNAPIYFIDCKEKLHEEIFLMSLCRHHIISDDRKSYWGAWLDPRISSFTFVPIEYMKNFDLFEQVERIPERWMLIERP